MNNIKYLNYTITAVFEDQ